VAVFDFFRGHGIRRRLGLVGHANRFEDFQGDIATVPDDEKNMTALHRLFYNNADQPLVHKWRHYLRIYDHHLDRFRHMPSGNPLKLLEIGVSCGGSLRLWRKYFGPDAVIFGIDIDEQCSRFNGQDAHVRIGSQADRIFLEKTVAEMGGIDVVIDDGSHVASHQKISFDVLFPLLSESGVYLCEDLHTAYWRPFEGGYRRKTTFIEMAKSIVDDLNSDFHNKGQTLPNANRAVGGVHFYNSMVVIEKERQEPPSHIRIGIVE
jgi:hypothetical protein